MLFSKKRSSTKYIFITGGVVSSLGKGVCSASIGALLQASGYSVRLRKLDPYLNVDPGTMNPSQHGEVFVTDDGAETDLDLGHYERFTGVKATGMDSVSSGKIYSSVIEKERRGDYLGATIQVIPHITDEIKDFILDYEHNDCIVDFIICEIGGTVGDIEGLPFIEAIRQMRNDLGEDRTLFVHLTLVPYLNSSKELKTKPTQHSVKELQGFGIRPDIIICRSDNDLPPDEVRKISLFCNVPVNNVISAPDMNSIYSIPENYYEQELDKRIYKHFGMKPKKNVDLKKWKKIRHSLETTEKTVKIAIVGKYTNYQDSYKSLIEALTHAGIANKVDVNIDWVDAETELDKLADADGILIPGGFGNRGIAGKIQAAKLARTNKIPYFGICLGMQIAVIEFAKTVCWVGNAGSTEFDEQCDPIIDLLETWTHEGRTEVRSKDADLGGTMRLGAYPCALKSGTLIHDIYKCDLIHERHRHRYEMDKSYQSTLERGGMTISGFSPDMMLPEAIEIKDHPWFVGVQFHPEFKSRPFDPHPLFVSFVKASMK